MRAEDFPTPTSKSLEDLSPQERVQRFAKGLFFKLGEDGEKPNGQNLFEIEGLEIKSIYPPLVSQGTISILPGKIKALVGPNGSGKTTFFKTFLQKQLTQAIKHKPGLTVGYLPQEGDFTEVANLTLEETIDHLADIIFEQSNYESEVHNLVAIYKNVFFQGVLGNKVGQLSGGEKTKLQMLALLLRRPDVVFLDEPTNHIDQEGQALLAALIKRLKAAGVSFVCSSHNEKFLRELCEDGTIEISVTENTRTAQEHKQFDLKKPKTDRNIELPWIIEKSIVTSRPLEGRNFDILGHEIYFEHLEPNQKTLLAGPNGSGKTTFLRQLCERSQDGERVLNSETSVAYLPQELPEEILNGSLDKMVEWCVKNNARHFDVEKAKANFYSNLEKSDMKNRRSKDTKWKELQFKSLSAGEQRFLWFLAVASSPGFNFLVLDEPTNHLDPEFQSTITQSIESFPGNVLVVTHDSELMDSMLKIGRGGALKDGVKFWLLERGADEINSWSGAEKYFTDLSRKATQAVKQLGLS